jgi:hypothetical protein
MAASAPTTGGATSPGASSSSPVAGRGGASGGASKSEEARERVAYEKARYGSPSKQSAPFARYSGKSVKGQAKLHLAEFGNEADGGDRAEVEEVLTAYLAAVGAREWEAACSYLTGEDQTQLPQSTSGGPDSGSCGQQLPRAVESFSGSGQSKLTTAPQGISSLRIKTGGLSGEGAGFALFHGGDGNDYWMAVKREGGEWKILSTTPQQFR